MEEIQRDPDERLDTNEKVYMVGGGGVNREEVTLKRKITYKEAGICICSKCG